MKTARDVLLFIDKELIMRQQLAGPKCMAAVLDPEWEEIGRDAFRRAAVVEGLKQLRNALAERIETKPKTKKTRRAQKRL